jgi:MoxR-like ATPase
VGNDPIEAQRLLMKKRGELLTVANGGTVVQTQEEVAWPKITVFVQKFTLDRYSKNQESTLMTEEKFQRFSGASRYVLSDELAKIVNVSMALEMPLLLKGEPGTGKTMLAHAIAESLQMPILILNVKSSMKLVEALYQYDTLTRLNDSRFGDSSRNVSNISEYIRMGKIGQAFVADQRVVLLIDEIDKADTDFQDDMLDVLDQMQFDIIETDHTVKARVRPVVIITSNAKKDLSDPFLGRCNFHHIAFPEPEMMRRIVKLHFPGLNDDLSKASINAFYRLRAIEGIEKKPATRELLNWLRALHADPDFRIEALADGALPYLGVLFKKSSDLQRAASIKNVS